MQGEQREVAEHIAEHVTAVPDLGGASARAVYRDLLRFGPRSRRDLTERLGLSAPTVTRVTRDLLEAGHLHPLDTVALAKGRPSSRWTSRRTTVPGSSESRSRPTRSTPWSPPRAATLSRSS